MYYRYRYSSKQSFFKTNSLPRILDVCWLLLEFDRFTMVGTDGWDNPDESDCVDKFQVTVRSGLGRQRPQ